MRVLMITSEWPSPETPHAVPFIVRQVEFLRRAGVNIEVFHFRGGQNFFNYLSAWFQVQQLLVTGYYDLVHAQWGQSALLALPKKLPIVITYRGSDLDGMLNHSGRQSFAGGMLRLISKAVALIADQVIVVSRHLANELPKCSYEVISSGLDLDLFRPMDKAEARHLLGFHDDESIILFAGNPEIIDKRFELARLATDLIKSSCQNVRLLVASGIAYEQMPVYMNCSDVLVLTSAHEGSPNVVKEALACNLPVVSTDVGDVCERIGDIQGCIVCENDEPKVIAEALKWVLMRDSRINGRKYVLDLDESLLTQKVTRVYQRALEKQCK